MVHKFHKRRGEGGPQRLNVCLYSLAVTVLYGLGDTCDVSSGLGRGASVGSGNLTNRFYDVKRVLWGGGASTRCGVVAE